MAAEPTSKVQHQKPKPSSRSTVSIINPFRKKLTPRPPPPTEPYQVFPGIWNTDATAKVFGYLDSNEALPWETRKERRPRGQHSPPRNPQRTPVFVTRLLHRYREAHHDDGTDDFSSHAHRRHIEAQDRRRQANRDEAKREREESRRRGRRYRMRTVSREDELMQRGANPRTGTVSPYVESDDSRESIMGDYLAVGSVQPLRQAKRERSGRWKQDHLGWSLVQSPLLSPSVHSSSGKLGHAASAQPLQDKFVVEMPGVDNPEPAEMTAAQIERFQEGFERICKSDRESVAGQSLDYFPSRRPRTPEQPSTPLNRGQKIRRKEVGSGRAQRSGSTDTVIVRDPATASSSSTPGREVNEERRVRIVIPSHTPTSLSASTPPSDRNVPISYSYPHRDGLPGQTTNTAKSPSRPTMHQGINRSIPTASPALGTTTSVPPSSSLTLSHYLPRLSFLHPSNFASLTTSYRRPTELLPTRLRPVQRTEETKDNFGNNDPTTSDKVSRTGHRPPMQRQDGSTTLPKIHVSGSDQKKKKQNMDVRATHPVAENFPSIRANTKNVDLRYFDDKIHKEWVVPDSPGVDIETRRKEPVSYKKVEGLPKVQSNSILQPKGSPSGVPIGPFQKRRVFSGLNSTREGLQNELRTIQIDGSLDSKRNRETSGVKMKAMARQRAVRTKKPSLDPVDHLELQSTGSEWFAGHWATSANDHNSDETNTTSSIEGFLRERSSFRTVARLWRLVVMMQQKLCDSFESGAVHYRLMEMIRHVLMTLHASSPAFKIFRGPGARIEEYLAAIKDIFLALVYLLVLLNIFMVVGKVFKLVAKMIGLLWLPVKMIFVVARWFSVS